jgi:hypothetical protein
VNIAGWTIDVEIHCNFVDGGEIEAGRGATLEPKK